MISRRQLFVSGTALLGAAAVPFPFSVGASASVFGSSNRMVFASAYTSRDKSENFIALIDEQGALLTNAPVPSRGHSSCFSSSGDKVAFFARRPGRWIKVLDVASGNVIANITAESGRHFFGHGVFDPSGDFLYTTENDYENSRGVVGVYHLKERHSGNYQRVGEWYSGGIGPHELAMLSDGKTIVVANGGIETHPDYGRRKLNIDTMVPNLSYLDRLSGEVLEQVYPPHHQLSLRHLDIDKNDNVVVGAQFQGDPREDHPLLFRHKQGSMLKAMAGQSINAQRQLKQYIASISFSDDGTYVLSSAPRGDRVTVWNVRDWSALLEIEVKDVGGIAPIQGRSSMLLTTGAGEVFEWRAPNTHVRKMTSMSVHWDNHLISS